MPVLLITLLATAMRASAHPGHSAFDVTAGLPHPGHEFEFGSLLLVAILTGALLAGARWVATRRR